MIKTGEANILFGLFIAATIQRAASTTKVLKIVTIRTTNFWVLSERLSHLRTKIGSPANNLIRFKFPPWRHTFFFVFFFSVWMNSVFQVQAGVFLLFCWLEAETLSLLFVAVSPFTMYIIAVIKILFLMPRRLSCYNVTDYMGRFLGANQLIFGQLGSKGFATEKSSSPPL